MHVALRGGGALVTLDPASGAVLRRRPVCPAPRGVGWDASTDSVWVACATGELVALPAAGGSATKSFVLDRDLRDVLVGTGLLSVTKFRSAEVLEVSIADGTIAVRGFTPDPDSDFSTQVAWRAIPGSQPGDVIVVHQGQARRAVPTTIQGGYGGTVSGPPGVVESVLTVLSSTGSRHGVLSGAVLPVDVALSDDGGSIRRRGGRQRVRPGGGRLTTCSRWARTCR